MAEMFMEKMHAFGNLLQDEWQVFTTPETHLPKIDVLTCVKIQNCLLISHLKN
jgi:hypothetical protein